MKQRNLLGVIILLAGLFACGQIKNKETKQNSYKGYKLFETKDYSIQYPNDWRLDTSGYMGTALSIFSKQSSLLDKFIENVSLTTHNSDSQEINLTKVVIISEEKIKSNAPEYELIESKRLNENAKEFHKNIYTIRQGIYLLKYVQYYWLENQKTYVLTFACRANEFNKYQETGTNIMNSFKLK